MRLGLAFGTRRNRMKYCLYARHAAEESGTEQGKLLNWSRGLLQMLQISSVFLRGLGALFGTTNQVYRILLCVLAASMKSWHGQSRNARGIFQYINVLLLPGRIVLALAAYTDLLSAPGLSLFLISLSHLSSMYHHSIISTPSQPLTCLSSPLVRLPLLINPSQSISPEEQPQSTTYFSPQALTDNSLYHPLGRFIRIAGLLAVYLLELLHHDVGRVAFVGRGELGVGRCRAGKEFSSESSWIDEERADFERG